MALHPVFSVRSTLAVQFLPNGARQQFLPLGRTEHLQHRGAQQILKRLVLGKGVEHPAGALPLSRRRGGLGAGRGAKYSLLRLLLVVGGDVYKRQL